MSVETSNRAWKHSQKGGTPLLLLLAMADWSDDWGYCHPSIEQMAVKCRQTDRNILNLIAELEKAGEVRRVARGKGGRGKFSGSVYQVIVGMNAEDVIASGRISPLAQNTFAKLQNGEMSLPIQRNLAAKTDEKFSPEKQRPDSSSLFPCALKELINVSDSPPPSEDVHQKDLNTEEQAQALYRLVRPSHLILPNSDQRTVALEVLKIYLEKFSALQAAAELLKPYAAEADARGIRQTNLCWLSEWAAVGQIPKPRRKVTKYSKPETMQEEHADYEALRKRMEVELTPHMQGNKRQSL
ncbi:MAG: helix-turn-helix domain-containing protein [Chloroflexota bacterium]